MNYIHASKYMITYTSTKAKDLMSQLLHYVLRMVWNCEEWAYENSTLDMAAESQCSGGAVVLRMARKDG